MSSDAMNDAAAAERLSALVDGELDEAAVVSACGHWKSDGEARCTWHAYQLIGDVLRSDELAAGAGANEQFLVSLRARLAVEPVVLAPAPLVGAAISPGRAVAARGWRGSRWMLPSAMAAGLVLVVGTFTTLRPGGLPSNGTPAVSLADASSSSASSMLRPASLEQPAQPMTVVMNGKIIRDARLDRYLAAHKQFSGSSALGLPSAFLRSATVESDGR